jgi:hypothetical protein
MATRSPSPLARVRALCLSFPEASERASHGAPTFFVRDKRAFVMYLDNHHDDGRLALWCAAPPGVQAMLVEAEPDHYFVPPYVGPGGWIGVRLDRKVAWAQVAAIVEQAYQTRAPGKPRRAARRT